MKVGHNLYKCEIECIVYTTKYPKKLFEDSKKYYPALTNISKIFL